MGNKSSSAGGGGVGGALERRQTKKKQNVTKPSRPPVPLPPPGSYIDMDYKVDTTDGGHGMCVI